jgi:hypothetical protein
MPLVGFKPTTSVFERTKAVYALDAAASVQKFFPDPIVTLLPCSYVNRLSSFYAKQFLKYLYKFRLVKLGHV